jgi:hypothetical protein
LASEAGEIAADLVSEESFRHFLDDMLYTHDGDDRQWGPEHDLARDNIEAILAGYGLDVALEPFPYNSDTYYNVVATKWGTVDPNQEYIIGAHFDSINTAGGDGAPGADDNATGVALMLEAARVLSEYDSDYTIRFIAFDRHEQGTVGSQAYVSAHPDDTILGVIAPDMIGSGGGSLQVIVHAGSAFHTFRDAVGAALLTYGPLSPSLQSDFMPCLNDHCPFEDAGIPGCRLLEAAYLSNPYDHTSEDSVDRPGYIDYAYATKITRSIVGFLVDHALNPVVAPGPPTYWEHQAKKHRYLSIDPNANAPDNVAIKVEVAEMRRCQGDPRRSCRQNSDCRKACENDLDAFCVTAAQCVMANCIDTGPCMDIAPTDPPPTWWVQQPQQITDGCVPSCTDEDWVARLEKDDGDPGTAPYSEDWSGYADLLHIGDCPIVPCATYNVYACDPADTAVCSVPLVVATTVMPNNTPRNYGDVVGPTDGELNMTPPDGFVNVSDITAWLLTKQNYGTSNLPQAHPTWMDLHGLGTGLPPNYILGVSDLMQIYSFGFVKGLPWKNASGGLDPQDCP